MNDEHLRSQHYVDIDRNGTRANLLARSTVRHLVETCPDCKSEWEKLGPILQDAFLTTLEGFTAAEPVPPPDDDDLLVDDDALKLQGDYMDHLRQRRRRACEQLWILRRLPVGRRAAKIRSAYRQFRDRALAELLIEEARSLVRTKPDEALTWLDLVPVALAWARGDEGHPWAPSLLARAAAHRANALRIRGDHPAAERIFVELRRSLAARPVGDPAAVAEITSLEASLRIEQRHLVQAEELLDRAALAYQYAGDPLGLARARIKQAILVRNQGRPAECLSLLEAAATGLASGPAPADLHLLLSIVTERVNALCDLERFAEARRLLERHVDDYEESEEPYTGTIYRSLDGRIALGTRDFERAESAFVSSRDAFLVLGRFHDAALACLDLAEVFCALGRFEDLRQLAAQLVPLFGKRQLPAETMKALDLLVQAVTAQRLTLTFLAELRRDLSGQKATPAPLRT